MCVTGRPEPGAERAEGGEVLVAELAAAREAVRHLAPRLRMSRVQMKSVRQAGSFQSPVSRACACRSASGKPPCVDEQAVGEEQSARRAREEAHGQLAGALDPFMREVRVQELGEVGRRHGRAKRTPS